MNRALVVVSCLASGGIGGANTRPVRLQVDYVAPTKPGVVGAPADHLVHMRRVIAELDRETRLPRVVKIAYRECGAANSYYRGGGTIEICHELWDERRRLYRKAGFDDKTVELALRGAMTFTFFHELGHALHRELALPLVGRWEDAVDEIATIAMIGRGLADAAAHAAYGHHLRSVQPRYSHDDFDEHGSAGQRAFAIACLLYGADATRHAALVARMNIPTTRLAKCVREYPERVKTWAGLIKSVR